MVGFTGGTLFRSIFRSALLIKSDHQFNNPVPETKEALLIKLEESVPSNLKVKLVLKYSVTPTSECFSV